MKGLQGSRGFQGDSVWDIRPLKDFRVLECSRRFWRVPGGLQAFGGPLQGRPERQRKKRDERGGEAKLNLTLKEKKGPHCGPRFL